MDLTEFRSKYPEFNHCSDDLISQWSIVAQTLLPERKWVTLFKKATSLYVAHQISMAKSSDKFDHQQVTKGGPLFWAQSSYGRELMPWIKLYGI